MRVKKKIEENGRETLIVIDQLRDLRAKKAKSWCDGFVSEG